MSNKDQLIIEVEEWLNANYSDHPGFGYLEPEGRPGNTVVSRLIMALQIELGIVNIVPTFGPGTESAFQNISRDRFDEEERHNLVYILQGSFWAKGYSPGTFDGRFNAQTENAILRFQSDVGFEQPNGVVDAKLMKALLNTDGFRLSYSGKPMIRLIQQILNTEYADGFFDYIPTNGVYERQTNKALIYALQVEIGIGHIANGSYGPSTVGSTPTLRPGNSQTGVNRILKFALTVNGAPNLVLDGNYDETVEWAVREFQAFMTLPVTGIADMPTIKQLLTSNGYVGRPAKACDASMIINYDRARTLKESGYEVIGRYLTGTVGGTRSKAMTHSELTILKDQGIRVFPIFQDGGANVQHFNENQGIIDAKEAVLTAYRLGFPEGTTIYFAVDFDAYDYQITQNIIPYMAAVRKEFEKNNASIAMPSYELGVYGARNVCIRCAQDPSVRATSSFVSNMSTGFSGNLGFPMPENWSFGQFFETSIGSGSGYLEIDKNDYSGRDTGTTAFNPVFENRDENEQALFEKWKTIVPTIAALETDSWLLSTGFEFGKKYILSNNPLSRLEVETSVEYTTPSENSNIRIDVQNGEIQGSIETIFSNELRFISSEAVGLLDDTLNEASTSIDNGFIEVGLGIVGKELHLSMSLYNEDVEIPEGTINLGIKITLVLKLPFPDFSEEQVADLMTFAAFSGGVLALLLIANFLTGAIAAQGAAGIFAALIDYFGGLVA